MYERTRQGAWRRRPEEVGQRVALRLEKALRANRGGPATKQASARDNQGETS
jgi:hypothetical protein